jgi:hypothetical protein
MEDFYLKTTCRMCSGGGLEKVMSLAPTPPGNNFLSNAELELPEASYPLDLYLCGDCKHLQLGHVVDPKILYQKDYFYVSGTSNTFIKHLQDYAESSVKKFKLDSESFVVDIGSNDGTCLRSFKDAGIGRVLGVDPASKIAQRATESGIPTVPDFFSHELAVQLNKEHGRAKLITSHNACAHIDRLDDVIKGVHHWLSDDGVFVLEVGYLVDVYQNAWFDTIYHEHLDFHTVRPFKYLFKRFGMELLSVERIAPQGGSIRVSAQRLGGPRVPDSSIENLIELEDSIYLGEAKTFKEFNLRINEIGSQLRALIRDIKDAGSTIAAFGAPTKSTTLLAHFQINPKDIDFIVDDNPLKQGLHSPLKHIPVLHPEEIYIQKPDYLLILAWNFAESIMVNHKKYSDLGGKFIVPMPNPKVIAQ